MEEHTSSPSQRNPFIVGRGPRDTEELLLTDLDTLLDAGERDPSLLSRPVIVVVPSNSLRDHLAARIVSHRGRAVAGVTVVTLFALARDVLRSSGGDTTSAALAYDILARRAARRQEVLWNVLNDLDDGFASVVGSIRDLLDAGLTEAHRTAAEERLEELSAVQGSGVQAARAQGLVRAAASVDEELQRLHGLRPGAVYATAAELLTASAGDLLPAREVLIHGYADATGVATALLHVLLGRCGARMYIDRPPDPVDPQRVDSGAAFSQRFLASLGWAPPRVETATDALPVTMKLFHAPGAHAEAREVARRVRTLLGSGVTAERIGVVARDLAPYVVPLRVHLRRLAVPSSGIDVVVPFGSGRRRLAAVAGLLEEGEATPADLWLDATVALGPGGDSAPPDASLRLALRALGAGRLADVAALDLDAAGVGRAFRLPIRGRGDDEDGNGGDTERLHRRTVHREVLDTARGAARRLVTALARWPGGTSVRDHVARLVDLLVVHLGWRSETATDRPAFAAVAALAAGLGEELSLSREELALLLRRTLEVHVLEPLGGAGGGVQVMTVTAARGRTFEHLFVLGLNRDRFPRQVGEDPLLPDHLRRALRDLLPDLPLKGEGHTEDRYLFAQLLTAAPNVTLSWLSADDDGAEQSPSPLVERLRLAAAAENAPTEAPALLAPPADVDPLPAHERALHSALYGEGGTFRGVFELTGREMGWEDGAAAARLAALREADGGRHGSTLGPMFGFIGTHPSTEIWITALERMAGCPWRAFLERELGIEPPPDPLAAPAGIAPPMVGTLVHAVLQAVVSNVVGPAHRLAELLGDEPVTIPEPESAELQQRLAAAALRLTHAEGVPHLAAPLAARAEPFVRLACALLWGDGPLAALGAEVVGQAAAVGPDGPVAVSFRADLVERRADHFVLTDFKTGKPLSTATTQSRREIHLLQAVARGDALQAAAYARGGGAAATGRYLYLKNPEDELPAREFAVAGSDDTVLGAFDRTVATLLTARAAGVCFPRLLKPDLEESFEGCRTCEVVEACLQPDSGARRRLARWVERMRGGAGAHGAEAAAFGVWRLRDSEREEQ